ARRAPADHLDLELHRLEEPGKAHHQRDPLAGPELAVGADEEAPGGEVLGAVADEVAGARVVHPEDQGDAYVAALLGTVSHGRGGKVARSIALGNSLTRKTSLPSLPRLF